MTYIVIYHRHRNQGAMAHGGLAPYIYVHVDTCEACCCS